MRQEKAFALIAIITLLCLVAVVCLGLLSLSSLSLRGSNASAAQVSAQANARLAMLLALDRLQKYTGPDQRVTATAELTVPPNRYSDSNLKWTGVWATTQPTDPSQALSGTNPPDPTKPVVTGAADPIYPDRKYLSDYRNRPGYSQKSLMLAWLVSGDPSPSAMPSSPSATTSHITLVEKAAGLADPSAPDPLGDRVTAPLVKISPGSSQAGGYAFWIGDESLKARIDQKPSDNQPDLNDPNNGGMTRLAGGEGPNVRFVQAGAATKPYGPLQDAKGADRTKLISRDSVGLMLPGSNGVYKKNFHDLTSYSESVLADVRDGGLKKDLTSYISQTTSPPAIANIPETGLANDTSDPNAPGRAMLPGPLYAKFGPNYLQLRNWYNLRKKVTGGFGSGAMDPVFLKTRNSVAAWGISWGVMPDLKSREQSVQPLIAEARIAFDFSLDQGRGGGMAIRTHAYPLVKLWNPYNVTLKARRYLVGFPRYIYLSAAGYTVKAISTKPAPPRGTLRYFGDAEGDALYFTLEAVDLAPGECLYFSPKTSGESDKYDPTNIAANILSPSIPAGGTENFHFDADVMLQGPAYNPATPIQYSITNWPMRNYFLKDAGTSSSPITSADAQSSPSYPIIQKLAMDSAGDGSSSSPVGNPFPNPGGNSPVPLRTATTHAGTVPLYSWYMGARLRRFDENLNEQVGGYGGTPGRFPLRNPLLSAFNVRPQILHRCNFCTQYDWFWWTVGAYINSRADQVITDTATMSGRMVNGKCLTSPFGTTADYGSAKSFALFEVPRTELPPASLANFQHAQLGYQSWQPTYIVGHSFANGRSDRNAMVNAKVVDPSAPLPYYEHQKTFDEWDGSFKARYGTGNWYDLTQYTPGTPRELLIYDSCYAVNYALWDRYFLSTIPFDNNGNATLPTNSARMSNPAMMLSSYSTKSPATVRSLLEGTNSFDYASCFLMNQGGFNINSTSVEAWRAFFSSMNDVQRPARDGSGTVATAFSRLLLPGCTTQVTNHCAAGAWDGAKSLTEDEINRMAVAMVKNVKLRGPFLGLADFVNRRLTPTQFNGVAVIANSLVADPTMCGPLQAAIEESTANKNLQQTTTAPVDTVDPNQSSGGWWSNDRNHRNFWPEGNLFGPWRGQNAPGYLTQADILQGAGANITARGDTFVIRAYGDKRDASGKVIARAWCEAVVQRTPDYLAAKSVEEPSDNTGNNPMEPMVIRSTTEYSSTLNPKLNAINKKFGRRYVIKGFRWLNASEV